MASTQPKAPAPSAASLAIPPPIYSPFLDEQCAKIDAKGVSWEVRLVVAADSPVLLRVLTIGIDPISLDSKGYQRAKLVTPEEVTLLKSLEKQVGASFI